MAMATKAEVSVHDATAPMIFYCEATDDIGVSFKTGDRALEVTVFLPLVEAEKMLATLTQQVTRARRIHDAAQEPPAEAQAAAATVA